MVAMLIAKAEAAGISLTLADSRLSYTAPQTAETAAILAELRQHRLAVAAYLRRPQDPTEAGRALPENMRRFDALVRLDRQDRQRRGLP